SGFGQVDFGHFTRTHRHGAGFVSVALVDVQIDGVRWRILARRPLWTRITLRPLRAGWSTGDGLDRVVKAAHAISNRTDAFVRVLLQLIQLGLDAVDLSLDLRIIIRLGGRRLADLRWGRWGCGVWICRWQGSARRLVRVAATPRPALENPAPKRFACRTPCVCRRGPDRLRVNHPATRNRTTPQDADHFRLAVGDADK